MVNSLAVSSLYAICDCVLDAGLILTRQNVPLRCNLRMRQFGNVDSAAEQNAFTEKLIQIPMQDVGFDVAGFTQEDRLFSVRTGTLALNDGSVVSVTAVRGLDDADHCLYLIYKGSELSAILSEEILKGEHYDFFAQLFDRSPIAMALLDNADRIIQTNDSFSNLFGYPSMDTAGRFINELIAYDPSVLTEAQQLSISSVAGETVRLETNRYHRDGTPIPVTVLAYPVVSRDQKVAVYAMYSDNRERKAFENHMKLYLNVLESSTEGICILDTAGNLYWNNGSFLRMTGHKGPVPEGTPLEALNVLSSHVLEFVLEQILENGLWKGEALAYGQGSTGIPVLINGYRVNDHHGKLQYYILFFNDITDYKQKEERLHFLSSKDSLTGLANRVTFLDTLRDGLFCASAGDEYAVLYIDLDDFKLINDSISHAAGDEVLKYAAKLFKACLRESDLISRYGGDEFAIILKDRNVQGLTATVCDRIFEKLKKPIFINDTEMTLSASIGIAFYPQDGVDAGTLVRHGEIAMYRAKRDMKNSAQAYRDDMKGYYHEQYHMRNALRCALRNKELYLMYQPVVDRATERTVGFEALCRWENPKLGSVPPSQFIPLAEASGFIVEMGEWILTEACRQMKHWQELNGEPLFIAVNTSVKQLESPGFVERVQAILQETGLHPECLEMEVTESIQMEENTRCIEVLDQLRQLGVSLAMDDFGTGYSSLAQLSRMPLSKLKIDRSFIVDFQRNHLLIEAIVAMAGSLNLKVVAEGVERADQLKALHQNQCHFIQGYYYSKPLMPGDAQVLLKRQETESNGLKRR